MIFKTDEMSSTQKHLNVLICYSHLEWIESDFKDEKKKSTKKILYFYRFSLYFN